MNSNSRIKKITYKLFVFDTYINWILGTVFLFFSKSVEKLMSDVPLLPQEIWIIIGLGLLFFGFWQTFIIWKKKFSRSAQLFSCITAWIPFLILTYALVFMKFSLFIEARLIIWVGNIYMLILGWFYFLSRFQTKTNKYSSD